MQRCLVYLHILQSQACQPWAGYAHTAGIATVAQNLTGTPSIVVDNINGTWNCNLPWSRQ